MKQGSDKDATKSSHQPAPERIVEVKNKNKKWERTVTSHVTSQVLIQTVKKVLNKIYIIIHTKKLIQ